MRGVSRLRGLAAAFLVAFGGAAPAGAASPAAPPATASPAETAAFRAFIDRLWPKAEAAGIARATFDDALRPIPGPDPKVLALTRKQSEFSRPIGAYVEGAAGADRVAKGRALAESWSSALDRIERDSGVPRAIVLAIWGLESGFGAATGGFSVLRSLATLAAHGERAAFFEAELIAALRILQEEHAPPSRLTGSWAGAMGQTQFMPSTFLAAAVDGDGDGHRDIWDSVPDVLASIANLLARSGWQPGLPPAPEVKLPPGLDVAIHRRSFADWAARGVTLASGAALPRTGDASLFLPAGIDGPAFLLGDNFEAIRAYNTSDAYALGVSRLADRIAGAGPLARPWPTTPTLTRPEIQEVQARLEAARLYSGPRDGRLGAKTRDAVRAFQIARGLTPDGFASRAVLEALRAGR